MIKRHLNTVMSEDWLKSALVLALLAIGCIGLIYGARMSYKFGEGMSHEHGVTLMLVALFAAAVFPASHLLRKYGWGNGADWARRVGVLFLAVEFVTHMGYTFGQRHQNVTLATHQTVAYQEQQSSLTEEKRKLEMFEKRLSDLEGRNAWLPTVTADGLRSQIETQREAIRQEERRGGCGPRCLALKTELAGLETRRAAAEERKDLTDQIQATKRVLDKQRDKVAVTDLGNSAVVEQSQAFAKIATLNLRPDADSIDWVKYALGIMIALVTVIIAPAAFELAVKLAGMAGIGNQSATVASKPANENVSQPTESVFRETSSVKQSSPITVNVQKDDDIWQVIHSALNQPKRIAA
jgi:hypothetical protein